MVAQAGSHLHMAAQFLVPVILALVFAPDPADANASSSGIWSRVWRPGCCSVWS